MTILRGRKKIKNGYLNLHVRTLHRRIISVLYDVNNPALSHSSGTL